MSRIATILLRTGLAVTFIWVGVLIYLYPSEWAFLLLPWAKRALTFGGSLLPFMRAIALFNVIIGAMMLLSVGTWVATLLGGISLVIALSLTGFTQDTVRDIGLFGGCMALFFLSAPETVLRRAGLLR